MPSIKVNSKCGRVLPTLVPFSGCSTIIAGLGGATVGTDADFGVGLGRGVDVGIAGESGRAVNAGATVDSGAGVGADAALD